MKKNLGFLELQQRYRRCVASDWLESLPKAFSVEQLHSAGLGCVHRISTIHLRKTGSVPVTKIENIKTDVTKILRPTHFGE